MSLESDHPTQIRADIENHCQHPWQFTDVFLKRYSAEIPETGQKILRLLFSRDIRVNYITNYIECQGSMSSLHLEEPYQETGGDFKPYVHIRNQEFDINPHLDYGYSYNAIRENIAFEPELLIAALKIANSGTEVESSGQGKYHKGGVGDLSEGEPKRIIIKIWVSENTDRVVFTFLADGLMFAQIDAGEKSEEKLNDYRYDQLVFEYWEEEKKDKKKTPES